MIADQYRVISRSTLPKASMSHLHPFQHLTSPGLPALCARNSRRLLVRPHQPISLIGRYEGVYYKGKFSNDRTRVMRGSQLIASRMGANALWRPRSRLVLYILNALVIRIAQIDGSHTFQAGSSSVALVYQLTGVLWLGRGVVYMESSRQRA